MQEVKFDRVVQGELLNVTKIVLFSHVQSQPWNNAVFLPYFVTGISPMPIDFWGRDY